MADLITINDKAFLAKLEKLAKIDQDYEKEIRKALRESVKIWADAVNRKVYSGPITKRSGGLGKAMGVGTFKSEAKGYIGGKSRPKRASNKNGGWRAHFFASPASQMDGKYRFDFQKVYNRNTRRVLGTFTSKINKILVKAIS
jgi:hypothetical protein